MRERFTQFTFLLRERFTQFVILPRERFNLVYIGLHSAQRKGPFTPNSGRAFQISL